MTTGLNMTETIAPVPEGPAALVARTVVRHALLLAGLFVLLSSLYWVAVYAVGGQRGLPLDDAYIHLQYARSIWEGHPFEYNYETVPGIRSSGTSAPLWTAMLTGTYWLTRDWLTAAYTLGVIWTIPCVVLIYWLLHRWTGKTSWTLLGTGLFVLTHPTVISAYEGMEPAAYVATFLLGLLFYDFSCQTPSSSHGHVGGLSHRHLLWRLAASAVFAATIWLRPEFLLMPMLIAAERALMLRRGSAGWQRRWLGEMALHAGVWLLMISPYLAFNWWVSGTLLPNTYTIKAIARNSTLDAGLPAAWFHKSWQAVGWCLGLGVPFMVLTLLCGLIANNAVLALSLPKALRNAWRGGLGAAGLLAAICVGVFPIARAMIDPIGSFPFQLQRYFAHITALLVLLAVTLLATRSAAPTNRIVTRAILASLLGPLAFDFLAVKGIDNINDMQVSIGRWLNENTPPGSAVATNDVGAIAFYAHRRIIDTVGLTEPALARHYLAGGTLEQYLWREKPQYAALFPNWHDRIGRREDLFQRIGVVDLSKGVLDRNMVCGGDSMWVLRTCWNKDFDRTQSGGQKVATAELVHEVK
jgi:hypothetical protein